MTRISRAPVLSATRRRVSFWITAPSSLRPLDHFNQPPALEPRQRPRLAHDHGVADVRVVGLVVSVQRARRAHDLLVAAVAAGHVDPHRDRLVGLIGDDDALAGLLTTGAVLTRSRGLGLGSRPSCTRLLARPGALDAPGLRLAATLGHALGVTLLGRARLARL